MTSHVSNAVPTTHLEALKSKHAILSSRIEEAQKSPATTDFYLKELKKQKLAVKEQIFSKEQDNQR